MSSLLASVAAPAALDLVALSDGALVDEIVRVEEEVRRLDVERASLAAELAARSHRSLGDAGLAIRHGYLTPEAMLRAITKGSFADAARRIRVGALLSSPGSFSPVAGAVADGSMAIETADRIVRTLAPVVDSVSPSDLLDAAAALAMSGANADDAAEQARGLRDSLDRIGVEDREAFLRSQRSLRKGRVIDGLRRVTLVLDPESDAIVIGAIDHAMGPRLGGPRFTSEAERVRVRALEEDPRTNEQLALDTLVALVQVAVQVDDGTILGATKPGLRVTIPLAALESGTGAAWLEGSPEPVSVATARRLMCDAGALPIVLSGLGIPLDLGHPRRLFSNAQRIALAARDGGCRWPGCDRPASWCEAHHVVFHSKGGPTDLDNGILLCRRHHLLLHNHGWDITRPSPGEFMLVPPVAIDRHQIPRPMPSRVPPWLTERSIT